MAFGTSVVQTQDEGGTAISGTLRLVRNKPSGQQEKHSYADYGNYSSRHFLKSDLLLVYQ